MLRRFFFWVADRLLACRQTVGTHMLAYEVNNLTSECSTLRVQLQSAKVDLACAMRENELLHTIIDENQKRVEAVTSDHARRLGKTPTQ